MAVLTLYLDNSILGGYFDTEFEVPTRRLWRMAEAGDCRFVASVVTQQHVAIATTHGIGVLVTWNFRHLANYRREAGFNRVNLENGYPAIRIISPLEIVYESQGEEV